MTKRRIAVNAGDKYDKLTVVREAPPYQWSKYKHRMVLCKCDCGNEVVVRLEYLRSGHTKSCGCDTTSVLLAHCKTHGQSKTRIHGIWAGMLSRCRNKNVKSYKYYGAKGVSACEEWADFANFMNWALSNGYRNDLTIDRINPFGNYEPDNCRWIPRSEQRYNRRDTVEGAYDNLQCLCQRQ